jgi:hypothetical protein
MGEQRDPAAAAPKATDWQDEHTDALDDLELRMAAGNEQQQIGKFDPVEQPRGERMAFEVIDGEQRLAMGERDGLGHGEADDDAAQEARPARSPNVAPASRMAAAIRPSR